MSDGQQGFLADLELAKVPLPKTITVAKPVSTPRRDESGAAITEVPANNPPKVLQGLSTHSKFIEVPAPPPSAGPAMTVCLSSFEFLIFAGYSCSS